MILTIIGARPQFVKAAVVSLALKELNIKEAIIHTGQHYDEDMSDIFWFELGIPECELNLKVGSGTHAKQTAQMLEKLEDYMLENRQQIKAVLLYGDTNSTLAGAITASKLNIPIIHVEAGLRSFNRAMPEEINRVITDHLSQMLFCSSKAGVEQLHREGITVNVYNVGDVMYDALLQFSDLAAQKYQLHQLFPQVLSNNYSLLTVHRPANTDDANNLSAIIEAIGETKQTVIWPLHPRVQGVLQGVKMPPNLIVAKPLSYLKMLVVIKHCHKVITDSGGLQKEAYWSKKPCITLRDETEWTETTHNQWNCIVGTDKEKIIAAFRLEVDEATWLPLYGAGDSAKEIAKHIQKIV